MELCYQTTQLIILFSHGPLGKSLFGAEAALIAAVLVSFFPAIFGLSRVFMPDFAMAAMVTLTLLLMIRQDQWTPGRRNLMAWLVLAMTALIRQTFPLFLLGPILAIALAQPALKQFLEKGDRRPLLGLVSSLVIGIALLITLAGPWYFIQGREYVRFFYSEPHPPGILATSAPPLGSFVSLYWHTLKTQLLPPTAFLGIASFLYCLLFRRRYRALLASWILLPYVYFILRPPVAPWLVRYLAPLLPAVALCIGAFIADIVQLCGKVTGGNNRALFRSTLLFLICLEVALFFSISYHPSGWMGDPFGEFEAPVCRNRIDMGKTAPARSGFAADAALVTLEERARSLNKTASVFFLTQWGIVSEAIKDELEWARLRGESNLMISYGLTDFLARKASTDPDEIRRSIEAFQAADFAVIECYNFICWGGSDRQDNVMRPLTEHILKALDNYTVLIVLPGNFSKAYSPQCPWIHQGTLVVEKKR